MLAHQPRDALVVDLAALRLADLGGHASPAVAASMLAVPMSNLLDQLFIAERALRGRARALR